MTAAAVILGCLTAALSLTAFLLFCRLKQTKISLQNLLRENESRETDAFKQADTSDVYFKADRDFHITFINDGGANALGSSAQDLTGKHLMGTLLENNDASLEFLLESFNKAAKKQTTFNTQILLKHQNGKTIPMLARIRPILNEVLKCDGLSFLCKDVSQADSLQNKLTDFQSIDPFTNILNEQTFLDRFSHDFNLANRYNKELSAVVIELKDIYGFIAKGIDFETADKMLKNISGICLENLSMHEYAGRVDKTKIVLALKDASRDKAQQLSFSLLEKAVQSIKSLRIDEANAQMVVVSYSNRKGFSDSFDAMAARLQRHINMALRNKEYGVISSDKRPNGAPDLENIKG